MTLVEEYASARRKYVDTVGVLARTVKFVSDTPLNRFAHVSGPEAGHSFEKVSRDLVSLISLAKIPIVLTFKDDVENTLSFIESAALGEHDDDSLPLNKNAFEIETQNMYALLSDLVSQCSTVQSIADKSTTSYVTRERDGSSEFLPYADVSSLSSLLEETKRLRNRASSVNQQVASAEFMIDYLRENDNE